MKIVFWDELDYLHVLINCVPAAGNTILYHRSFKGFVKKKIISPYINSLELDTEPFYDDQRDQLTFYPEPFGREPRRPSRSSSSHGLLPKSSQIKNSSLFSLFYLLFFYLSQKLHGKSYSVTVRGTSHPWVHLLHTKSPEMPFHNIFIHQVM